MSGVDDQILDELREIRRDVGDVKTTAAATKATCEQLEARFGEAIEAEAAMREQQIGEVRRSIKRLPAVVSAAVGATIAGASQAMSHLFGGGGS